MTTLVVRTARLEPFVRLLARLNRDGIVPDVMTKSGSEAAVRQAGRVGKVYSFTGEKLSWAGLSHPLRLELLAGNYDRVIVMYNNRRGRGYARVEGIARHLRGDDFAIATPDGEHLLNWRAWWPLLRILPESLLQQFDAVGLLAVGGVCAAAGPCPNRAATADPLRILHVIYDMDTGGGQHQLASVIPHFSGSHYRMEVAMFGRGEMLNELPPGTPVHFLETPGEPAGGFWLLRLLRLWQFLRENRYDLVHAWMFMSNAPGSFAARAAGVPALNYVVNVRDWKELPEYRRWWYHPLDFLAARSASATLGNSRRVADDYRDWTGIAGVGLVHSGVEPEKEYAPARRTESRQRFGFSAAAPVVAVTARLYPEKDLGNFIAAARLVRDSHPEVRFAIFGDGPLRAELVRQAAGLEIKFIPEPVDYRAARNALDVFVLSSLSEGLPIALLAAGAAGKPCVVTSVGGNAEIVEDGISGWVVPPADSPALAAAIGEALARPEEAARRARLLQERVRKSFTLRQTAAGFAEVYDRVLWRGRQGPFPDDPDNAGA